ncbi:exopolysaccharide biosynthesis polyprenyl glycosylphosphotransferase [Belliella pelovolcani]|uniref:Putative colanic acid biosysnthesis UDP-glucose lipid carrier transferase n=2 Tax=Belliella pelovolcani TaxID=529505 RepID=A0A1N7K2J1_9BACT|nr:exopolysaccharide biosynthesis polyprenyl glycosylphosphotransferase [Belliella pelovolcani]SIS55810.1 putative colanic acid biosysnthesis UDP-glucose lipid carrier transferase [Belliella pelovolcani]
MKRRFHKYFPWLFVIGDLLVLVLGLTLSVALFRYFIGYPEVTVKLFAYFIFFWLLISVGRRDYKIGRTAELGYTLKQIPESLIWLVGLMAIFWIPTQEHPLGIFFLVGVAVTLVIFLSIYRVSVHLLLKQYRIQGKNYRNAVILGRNSASNKLAQVFKQRRDFGINFLGFYDQLSTNHVNSRGALEAFFEEAESLDLDLVYLSEDLDARTIRQVMDYADERYFKVKIIPNGNLQLEKNLSFSKYGEFFVINVNDIPLDSIPNRILKRSFDIVFSLFVTVFILSWMIPLVGILIKWESKGPIFFIQERNGVNNEVFKCLKFRSMTPNDYADTHQATKNDPRVTRIGSFLRRSSLDEMPQFLNVLFGNMSIVGPRPHTIPMNQNFQLQVEKYNSRHKIKPGITGLAQVRGYRGEIENLRQIRSRVRLDSFYIQNWSIWMDLSICYKTIGELLYNRENAY